MDFYVCGLGICVVSGKVASMVEQFNNLKGSSKQGEIQCSSRNVEITSPIIDYQPGMLPPQSSLHNQPLPEPGKDPDDNLWKSNPLFTEDDDDVPEIIKRISQNGLQSGGKQLSDTLSSDMIVNSISNGQFAFRVGVSHGVLCVWGRPVGS